MSSGTLPPAISVGRTAGRPEEASLSQRARYCDLSLFDFVDRQERLA